MGTLSRYLLIRTLGRFVLLLVVFLGILAGGQIAAAMSKGVPPDALGAALLGMCVLAMPIALPLALTTAVLVTMGALQRDGELRALGAAGIAPTQVAARLAPLIAAGVILSAILSHLVMPSAMRGFRENAGRFAQAAVVYRVASQYSILNEVNTKVFARAAAGKNLEDVYLFGSSDGNEAVVHADGARWYLGRDGANEGMGIELHGVTIIRRDADGAVMVAENPNTIQYPALNRVSKQGADKDVDTWSTPRLIEAIDQWQPGDPYDQLNTARLSLQLRLFMPVAVMIFAIFAAGLALTLGTADVLTGVMIVVAVVGLTTVPAVQYVKTSEDFAMINPGWLLWLPGLALLGSGLWMLVKPDHAREILARPLSLVSAVILSVVTALRLVYLYVFHRALLRERAIGGLAERATPATRALLPRALGTLDHYVLLRTVTRWLAVLVLGTFLLVLGEFMGKSSFYIRCIGNHPVDVALHFLYRLPEFTAMWMPISLGVSGMLMATPMLRQGSLVALAAAGIAQSRVFASLIPFAMLVGVAGVVIDDQVIPRLRPLADDAWELMSQDSPKAAVPARQAGWRSGPVFWTARNALPGIGEFSHLAVFDGRPGKPIAALIGEMTWSEQGWQLRDVTTCSTAGLRRFATCTPAEANLDLAWSKRSLALELRTDQTKTSNQLLRIPGPRTWVIIASRAIWIVAPFACLAMVLPLFTRWETRLRLGSVTAKAAVLLIVPLGALAAMQRLIATSDASPIIIALATIMVMSAACAWRWSRMRV